MVIKSPIIKRFIKDLEEIDPTSKETTIPKLIERQESRKRIKAPLPPEGGITLREAERRFGVSNVTIGRWAKEKMVPTLLRTDKGIYLDEKALAKLVRKYKAFPGRGRRTVYKAELQTA